MRLALTVACVLATTAATAPVGRASNHFVRAAHHRHRIPRRRHVSSSAAKHSHPSTSCANADTPATAASPDAMRHAIVCLTNQQRVERGLPSLSISRLLNRSAQEWTNDMVMSGGFTEGSDFAGRISALGYYWKTAGENIATGYPTPRQVVAAWMASRDHCRNILDPSFRDVGTGESPSLIGGVAERPATWTEDFGLLMFQTAPSADWRPADGCPY
jgi:uncharacterized protein YkwD